MKLVEGWDMIMEEVRSEIFLWESEVLFNHRLLQGRKKVTILSPFLRNYRILRASVARAREYNPL